MKLRNSLFFLKFIKKLVLNRYKRQEEIKRNKARLAAKGYSKKASIDYNEVFASVALLEAIKLIISLAVYRKIKDFSN